MPRPVEAPQSPRQAEAVAADSQSGSALLDNPIWNSLRTVHSTLALSHGSASRFPPEIGPLTGIPDQSAKSYADLRGLAESGQGVLGGPIVLFFEQPPAPPAGWKLLRGGLLDQMVCTEPPSPEFGQLPNNGQTLRRLTPDDTPAMVELAKLTEPGPFETRTIELGAFFGIFHEERLVAMAGQRLGLPRFVEVSAVCTHPDARGRGYAPALMSTVMANIFDQGKTPFLHSFSDNAAAIAVYRRLGFTFRRNFQLAVLQNEI